MFLSRLSNKCHCSYVGIHLPVLENNVVLIPAQMAQRGAVNLSGKY